MDLEMTANVPFSQTFAAPDATTWADRTTRMQMRDLRGELLIELTAFLEIDALDPTLLRLAIPGAMTAKLAHEGVYDVVSVSNAYQEDAFRLPKGRILVDLGVTRVY